jgi:hypothetical protein
MIWVGNVARIGEKTNAYRILVRKSEGRPRRRLKDNNKMDLKRDRRVGMDWIDVAQDRDRWRALANTVMNLRVPYNVGKLNS